MCGRQVAAVIDFAIGGVLAVEGRAIPGGDAGLVIVRLLSRVIPDVVDLIGLADLVNAAAATVDGDGVGMKAVFSVAQPATNAASVSTVRILCGICISETESGVPIATKVEDGAAGLNVRFVKVFGPLTRAGNMRYSRS